VIRQKQTTAYGDWLRRVIWSYTGLYMSEQEFSRFLCESLDLSKVVCLNCWDLTRCFCDELEGVSVSICWKCSKGALAER
jgi:hypothetical protein